MSTDSAAGKAAAAKQTPLDYGTQLRLLQIELVKLQRHFIGCGDRILVVLEGRDAAGKDGAIKRIVRHLSPRETRVIALGKPSDRETGQWYFQRFAPYLPARGEFTLFNRSWYNRAGVERVMGFCTADEYEEFMLTVQAFEEMLVRSGVKLLKYYLDISRNEQAARLRDRRDNPLKRWKVSPIDEAAQKKWKAYSEARDAMLLRTHHAAAPWTVLHADDKKRARLNLLRHVLLRLHYPGKNEELLSVDSRVAFDWPPGSAELPALA